LTAEGSVLRRKLNRIEPTLIQQKQEVKAPSPSSSSPSEQILAQLGSIAKLNDAMIREAFETGKRALEESQAPLYRQMDEAFEAQKNQKSYTPTDNQFQVALEMKEKPVLPQAFQLQNAGVTVPVDNTVFSEVNIAQKMKEWGSMCWKQTKPNTAGQIKNQCPGDKPSFENGLCYTRCNSNEVSDGATQCMLKNCPQNYYSSGIYTCQWDGPLTYGIGGCCTIFTKQFCDYPCPQNYAHDGMCSCTVRLGVPTTILKARTRGIGVIPTGCPSGTVQDPTGLLCYPPCPANSQMIGPVCWYKCPASTPVDCGAACGKSDCSGILNMVIAPLQVVVDIATGGTLGTAIRSGITAAKSAIKIGVTALVKGAAQKLAEGMSKEAVKSTLITMAQKAGTVLQSGVVDKVIEAAQQPNPAGPIAASIIDGVATVDPTGLTNVVAAFMHPLC